MPLAGGFLPNREAIAAEKRYPLEIHGCRDCGLIQIVRPVDPEILFQDYSFSSSTIKPLVDHFDSYAAWLANTLKPKRVVEFGCNDGVLLQPLEKRGITAIGVDISKNITDMAKAKGLTVFTGYFNRDLARQIRSEYGCADVVTGSNAFAHNEHPDIILEAANEVLSQDGYLCLEFMYAGDLLDQLQWDTLYHEHLTFYSLHSLSILLKRFGFHVVTALRLPMHGGALRVCAGKRPVASLAPEGQEIAAYEDQAGLRSLDVWKKFGQDCRRKIRIAADVYGGLSKAQTIWAYGAAGKATMWVNACNMDYLGAVVDASPLRAGKLMPGTHTPIVPPAEFRRTPPDHICVTAWNYADHIRAQEAWYQGIWSTPLPSLRFF
jgi:novobiocin biosynthesis protein NovU/D-mycarose 3-C-methyltransferase